MAVPFDREKVKAWLEQHWKGNHTCPVCAANAWTIGDLSSIAEMTGDLQIKLNQVYPVVPVMCSNCGHTLLFNALIAGILKKPVSDPTKATNAPNADQATETKGGGQ